MVFDLIVLGTEAAGLEAARIASESGQQVAVIENPQTRKTVSQFDEVSALPASVEYFTGSARFRSMNCVEILNSGAGFFLEARRFLLACGTRLRRPSHIPFDGRRILDSDEVSGWTEPATSVLVVGAGSQGTRAAAELINRGLRVSLVDQKTLPENPQEGIEPPLSQADWRTIQAHPGPVQWGTAVLGVEPRQELVSVYYENGAIESYAAVIFAVGRVGRTEHLDLPRAELLLDEQQRVWCDDYGQTLLPHIYAAGSVVGFPRFPGSAREEAVQILSHMTTCEIPRAPLAKPTAPKALAHS